jgi:hypothetical protein
MLGSTLGAVACTETPGYLPPCVDPQMDPCQLDAGSDGDAAEAAASDGSRATSDARDTSPKDH